MFDGWPTQQEDDTFETTLELAPALTINGEPVSAMHDAMALLSTQSVGRYTIRAPNGAGKTSFMKTLKFKLGDRGFYLPAHTQGLAWKANLNGLSTGQQMVSHLEEIKTLPDVTHILLDEWDANLDDQNTALFDQQLNATSQAKVVIEVQH